MTIDQAMNEVEHSRQCDGAQPRRPFADDSRNAAERKVLRSNLGIRTRNCPSKPREGMVLLIVIVVIAILTLSAYTYTFLMQAEYQATNLTSRRLQSKFLVDSGADSIRVFLSQNDEDIVAAGGVFDNPAAFQAVMVYQDESEGLIGHYTVISPSLDDRGVPSGFRYGLTDESTRLNLNVVLLADNLLPNGGRTLLMTLPGMTEDIADAILDWIDEDDEPRDYGAEFDYYASLDPPYAPKNGPLESITEMLLIRDITPELMFGADANQNGVIDGTEQQLGSELGEVGMALGWVSYLTLYSKERNLTREGLQKINVNGAELEQLYYDLRSVFDDEWSRYIIYLRQYGPFEGEVDDGEAVSIPAAAFFDDPDYGTGPSFNLSQVLDLVDQNVEVPGLGEEGEPLIIKSPIQSENLVAQLPLLMDNLSTNDGNTIPGRINLNQSPRTVLEGIPGMTPEIVDTIIAIRDFEPTGDNENRLYETWILAEGVVDLATMRTILPFVCNGGAVYRAEITGYFEDGSASSRSEVVIDSTEVFPRILFWRDKSHLQSGYELVTLGVGLENIVLGEEAAAE